MQTINEAIAYLVQQGKPENLARAAINEQYGGDEPYLFNVDEGKVTASTTEILETYNTYVPDMLEVTEQGITFEGELKFDLEGNWL